MKFKIFCLITTSFSLLAIDNPHFYRATNMLLEPRIEHDFLSTFDVTFASGSTDKGRNASGTIVPLLDIYGIHHITLPNTNPLSFSIDGTFSIKESNLFFIQNFTRGFLMFLHLPVRNLHIKDIAFTNLSKDQPTIPIKPLLKAQDIDVNSTSETGAGDFTCMLGWTHNYQNTTILDFIDITLATGFLAPTGKKKNVEQIFSLPLGYNGHWGIPLRTQLSFGMYEWITAGASFDTVFFVKNNLLTTLKTSNEDSNIIKLSRDMVTVKKGTIWNAEIFLKADHFMYGLSFATAYSCAGGQKTKLSSLHPASHQTDIINSDQTLHNWHMHTLHFTGEYDFAHQDSKTGMRIGIFYNYQLGGVRIFDTTMLGGSWGLDISFSM